MFCIKILNNNPEAVSPDGLLGCSSSQISVNQNNLYIKTGVNLFKEIHCQLVRGNIIYISWIFCPAIFLTIPWRISKSLEHYSQRGQSPFSKYFYGIFFFYSWRSYSNNINIINILITVIHSIFQLWFEKHNFIKLHMVLIHINLNWIIN